MKPYGARGSGTYGKQQLQLSFAHANNTVTGISGSPKTTRTKGN
jgi:hypothetical protein